jgi:hypothetical protein
MSTGMFWTTESGIYDSRCTLACRCICSHCVTLAKHNDYLIPSEVEKQRWQVTGIDGDLTKEIKDKVFQCCFAVPASQLQQKV